MKSQQWIFWGKVLYSLDFPCRVIMALPSAGNVMEASPLDAVGVGPVAWTQLLFTSLAAYFDFSAQPRLLGRGLMQSMAHDTVQE